MKTYKGIELFKAVANYELKNGTKLKCVHSGVYGQGIEVAEDKQILIWSDDKKPISYAYFDDRDFEFEIMEEESEEEPIDIEELKKEMSKLQSEIDLLSNEIGKFHNTAHSMRDRNNYMKEKLKEIHKSVNYLLEKESDK